MRVISGQAKGRNLKAVPGTGTRPTTDKVKEAIFSMVGPFFDGGLVLDLFAGTGGLGIEALSRGMEKAIFIDIEKKSTEAIVENLRTTGMAEQAEVYRNEASRAIKALAKRSLQFDLVFLDPPYRMKHMEELLLTMEAGLLFASQAIVLIEHEASYDYSPIIGGLVCERRAEYGDTGVTIYRYNEQSDKKAKGDGRNEYRRGYENSSVSGKL